MTTNGSDHNLPHDPLDDCLKQARWPEPTGLQRTRLEAQWDRLAVSRMHTRKRFFCWAVAASVFLVIGLGFAGWTFWNSDSPQVIPPGPTTSPPRLAQKPAVEEVESSPPEPLVRSATPFEKLAFSIAVKHRRQARANREPEPLVHALQQLMDHPDADVQKLCRPLQPLRAAYENLLLTQLGSMNEARQQAALKILAEIGSHRAIPVLDRLSRDAAFAKRAWPVALRLAPAWLLGKWTKTLPAPRQEDVLRTLLSRREDPEALSVVLHLVTQPASREQVIRAIQNASQPPVEALFAFLKQGTKEQRHAAGLVLGRMATPEITEQLLALARDQGFPPEVMIGLLNSPDETAARFVERAKQNPQTRPAVQLAYLEWQVITYTSTLPDPLEIP